MLAKDDDIQEIQECGSASEARERIQQCCPDILFLDGFLMLLWRDPGPEIAGLHRTVSSHNRRPEYQRPWGA
jgi:hypothetical protein